MRLGGTYTQLGHSVDAHAQDQEGRQALRRFFAKHYENERRSPAAAAQNAAFEKVKGLMASADLFDLAKLPEKDRELLRMFFLEERDKSEICKKFQISEDYLRVLLFRAKSKFRATYFKSRGAVN